MNPFQDFINSIKGAPQTVGNDLNASAIGSLNPFNFQPQQFLPRAGQDLVKAVGTPQHPNMFLAGEMGPAGAEEGAMGGLVDKAGNPLKAPTTVYSRGVPVKVNPEAQAAIDNPAPTSTSYDQGVEEFKAAHQATQPPPQGAAPINPSKPTSLPPTPPSFKAPSKAYFTSDVDKVYAPDAATSVNGQAHTNQIRSDLNKYGAQNYARAGKAANDLYTNIIEPEISNNPKPVSVAKVQTAFEDYLDKNRTLLAPGQKAQQAATDFVQNLLGDGEAIPPNSEIYTDRLFNLKQDISSQMGPVYNKLRNGMPLTDYEKTMVAANNTLGDVIKTEHPQVADAMRAYGSIKDAMPDLFKASQEEQGFGLPMPLNIGGKGIGIGVGNTLGGAMRNAGDVGINAATSPVGKGIGIAGLAGLGVLAGENGVPQKIANAFPQGKAAENNGTPPNDNSSPSVAQGSGIVSQPYSKIKADPKTGHFELPQTPPPGTNQRHYETLQDHNNAIASINSSYTSGTPAYNAAMTAENARWNGDQEQAKVLVSNPNVSDFMNNAPQYNADGKNLQDALAAPGAIGFWNGVKNVGSVRAYNDPQYQSLKQQIMAFNDEFSATYKAVTGKDPGSDLQLDTANSGAQAGAKYKAMMQWMSGTYGKYLDPWLAITSGTGAQTSTGTPESGAVGLPAPTSQGLAPILSHPQAFQPTGQEFENGNP